jgi:hypothetical protein
MKVLLGAVNPVINRSGRFSHQGALPTDHDRLLLARPGNLRGHNETSPAELDRR